MGTNKAASVNTKQRKRMKKLVERIEKATENEIKKTYTFRLPMKRMEKFLDHFEGESLTQTDIVMYAIGLVEKEIEEEK